MADEYFTMESMFTNMAEKAKGDTRRVSWAMVAVCDTDGALMIGRNGITREGLHKAMSTACDEGLFLQQAN